MYDQYPAQGYDDPRMDVEWSVNISDDETRNMRPAEVAQEYARGTLDVNDTFVWRDGMGDWIPLGQCQELMELIARIGAQSQPAPAYSPSQPVSAPISGPVSHPPHASYPAASYDYGQPASQPPGAAGYGAAPPDDDEDDFGSTVMMDVNDQAAAAPAPGLGSPLGSSPPPAAGWSGDVARQMASAPPPQDYGAAPSYGQHDYGSTAEVDPFADARPTASEGPSSRRVGERNEASALFSLDMIRAEAAKPAAPAKKKSDDPFADIMSLGGGGGIASAFAPPPIHAPAPPPPPPKPVQASVPPPMVTPGAASMPPGAMMGSMPPAMVAAPAAKRPMGVIIGVVAAVLLLGGVGLAFMVSGDSEEPTAMADAAAAKEGDEASAKDEAKDEAKDDEKKSDDEAKDEEKSDEEAKADEEVAAKDDDEDKGEKGDKPTETTASKTTTTTTTTTTKTADTTKDTKKTETTPPKDDKKVDEKKEEKKVAAAEFNRDAARSALAGAAGAASGCKRPGGPTGKGQVTVTFAPSGRATQATVGGPFAGTAVGSCAAAAFRGASVPPFSGNPVTVSKSFFIK
ncbi:MAG: GYF domain-containing protein [Polyangiaceae bacterium]